MQPNRFGRCPSNNKRAFLGKSWTKTQREWLGGRKPKIWKPQKAISASRLRKILKFNVNLFIYIIYLCTWQKNNTKKTICSSTKNFLKVLIFFSMLKSIKSNLEWAYFQYTLLTGLYLLDFLEVCIYNSLMIGLCSKYILDIWYLLKDLQRNFG